MSDPSAKSLWRVETERSSSPGRGADLLSDLQFETSSCTSNSLCAADPTVACTCEGATRSRSKTIRVRSRPTGAREASTDILGARAAGPRKPAEWRDLRHHARRTTRDRRARWPDDHRLIRRFRGITGGALDSHEALPGPIYLQGSEPGRVDFRNIMVTPARARR